MVTVTVTTVHTSTPTSTTSTTLIPSTLSQTTVKTTSLFTTSTSTVPSTHTSVVTVSGVTSTMAVDGIFGSAPPSLTTDTTTPYFYNGTNTTVTAFSLQTASGALITVSYTLTLPDGTGAPRPTFTPPTVPVSGGTKAAPLGEGRDTTVAYFGVVLALVAFIAL